MKTGIRNLVLVVLGLSLAGGLLSETHAQDEQDSVRDVPGQPPEVPPLPSRPEMRDPTQPDPQLRTILGPQNLENTGNQPLPILEVRGVIISRRGEPRALIAIDGRTVMIGEKQRLGLGSVAGQTTVARVRKITMDNIELELETDGSVLELRW
jgi:hypothetical protein